MPLNMQDDTGNMYSFVNATWNPIQGACPHECVYCSTKALCRRWKAIKKKYGKGAPIKPHWSELNVNLRRDLVIFVQNMSDLFARAVPDHIIMTVLQKCCEYPENTYLFQSKNPSRFHSFIKDMPPEIILGTTIESNREYKNTKAPHINSRINTEKGVTQTYSNSRVDAMLGLKRLHPKIKRMVTLEPIQKFDLLPLVKIIEDIDPAWINIGSDSKGLDPDLEEPTGDEVRALLAALGHKVTIIQKDNLKRLLNE